MKPLGVAIGVDAACVALPDGRIVEIPYEPGDLEAALRRLAETAALPGARVVVCLLPPLVEARVVNLPRMRGDEQRRVLARGAARYFLDGRGSTVVGAEPLSRSGSPVPVLAACAEAGAVEAVESACTAAGWRLERIVPAHAAWLAAARSARATDVEVCADCGPVTERIVIERGVLRAIRRTSLNGDSAGHGALARAARHAVDARGPELLSDIGRERRRRADRRVAAMLAAAAILGIVLAGAIELWAAARRLEAVRTRRSGIAVAVARAMAGRNAASEAEGRVATIARLEAGSPRWSTLIADLADNLPRDAHLVAFRAAGDSVRLDGVARQAATVFQAIQRMPMLAGVRADVPVRQGMAADGDVEEHFVLGGSVRP